MSSLRFSKLSSFQLFLGCVVLILTLAQLCMAGDGEDEEGTREKRFFGGFFGPPPLPGDGTSPVVCERYCRNRCLNGGYSGYLGVPGCNRYCDCSYYWG